MKKRMTALILVAALPLAGCAWSAEGLAETDPEDTYYSELAPDIIAGCISGRLHGQNPMFRQAEGHYVVLRENGYGIPIVRWDIIGNEEGSRIEFRRSIAMMSGEERAATCFTQEGVNNLSN